MILSKKQRIGVAVLLCIALVGWITYAVWPSRQVDLTPPTEPEAKTSKRPWSERRDSIDHVDSARFAAWKERRQQRYDSAKQAARLFYDSIRTADSIWRDSIGWNTPRHLKKDTILDLNHCDTAELQLIRGIGRYTAVQIVQYRERLGGFYSPEQLKDEVFGKLSLDTLLHHFTADPDDVQGIPVNSCSLERLQRHPYIRYEQAKAIYTLRRKNLKINGVDELRSLSELTEEDIKRIMPYLRFDR